MTFRVNNSEYFTSDFSVYSINTRKKIQLHRPIANLANICVLCKHKHF